MAKKRKLSDLTTQETEWFLSTLSKFKEDLDEEDEDGKSVIASLEHVMAKLQVVTVRISQSPRHRIWLL
jgi:hypothetical protein